MDAKDAYLVLYNALCCAGWALVWGIAVQSIYTGLAVENLPILEVLSNVYAAENLAFMLTVSQSAALLEIAHAMIGFVRSPVLVTAMQVMSRIVALVALVYSVEAQSKSKVHSFNLVVLTLLLVSAMGGRHYDSLLGFD